MASVWIVNVALFLPVVVGWLVASWCGWVLSGRGVESDGGGGLQSERPPIHPAPPWPVKPGRSAGPEDLARSA